MEGGLRESDGPDWAGLFFSGVWKIAGWGYSSLTLLYTGANANVDNFFSGTKHSFLQKVVLTKSRSPRPRRAPLLSNRGNQKKKDDAHVKPVRSITEKMRRHRGASSIITVERDHLRRRHFNVVSKFLFHNGFFSLYLIIFSDVLAVEAPSPVHSPEAPEPEAPPPSMCTMACFPCARYCLCCAAVTMACSAAVAATLLAAFLLRMFLFSR